MTPVQHASGVGSFPVLANIHTLTAPRTSGTTRPSGAESRLSISDWKTELDCWDKARSELGLIPLSVPGKTNGGDDIQFSLEVWRGSTDLPDYVACIDEKRDELVKLGQLLRAFARTNEPPRSLSVMLQADPGSGKTFLAKLLADKFRFARQVFDITTMIRRDDLLDMFDAIATEQANQPERRILVFVDEINAELERAPVFGSFLAPLEQGNYVRRGRVFSLKPCVWLFAGTGLDEDPGHRKSDKISDFSQRLTRRVSLDYRSLAAKAGMKEQTRNRVENQARLAAAALRRRSSSWQEASRKIPRLRPREVSGAGNPQARGRAQ
jgi:hypothetical protein